MKSTYQNKDWDSLSAAAKAEVAKVAIQKGIYSLDGIKNMYNEFAMGGDTSNTVPLGRRYWQAQSNVPTILEKKNTWVKQQKKQEDRKDKALRKWLQTEGVKELNKEVRDYLTASNATTWTAANKNPKNPHLQARVTKGAKAHASWEKEHPVLNTWGNVLGAVPFAVASAPLVATAGSGMAALGDAVAATSAGQAITAGLAPLATAASTNIAGAPLYTWADVGLSSLFGGHGIQTAINEGGISPTTALEIAPLGRLAKPMFNKTAMAIENYRYPLGRPQIPENFLTIKPQVRTKVGDVEIDNPNLLYHLDRGDGAGAFSNQGAYVEDGRLLPGIAKEGRIPYSWWNLGRPYATSVNGQPMTRLMTATGDAPEMLHVRSQNYPIGQWNGKRGLVLNSEYVNPEGVDVSKSTYTLDPNYGWKRVFTEEAPTIKWRDAVKPPKITSENAASITPEQWTAAQDAAIAKGDMTEAQRLRNLHFMVKAPKTAARYNYYTPTSLQHGTDIPNHYVFGNRLSFFNTHGGYNKKYRQNVYVNVPKLRVTNPKGYEIGHDYDLLLDADKGLSDGFVDLGGREITEAEENYLLNNMNRLFGMTPEEYAKLYETLPNYKNPSEMQLLRNDYPFIQFQQSHINSKGIGEWHPLVSELAVKNPKNIKLADAVTYDDNGVRIPLGLRDNFKSNDIRWAGSIKEDYTSPGHGLLDYLKNDKINAFLEGKPFYERNLGPFGKRKESFPSDWTLTKVPFSNESKEIINNSAKPRILAQAEKDIRDVYNPEIDGPDIEKYVKKELSYIEKQLDAKINEGYELGSDALFKAHDEGKTAIKTGGLQLTNNGKIVLREGEDPEKFAVHEWEHRRTNSNIGGAHYGNEKRLLRKAFTKEFRELSETVPDFKGMNMDDEMVTTVSDTREALIGKMHLRKTAPDLQNKMIDKCSDEKVFKAVEKANAYGTSYIKKMRELGKLTPELAQNIREALKHVGAYVAPTGIGLGVLSSTHETK